MIWNTVALGDICKVIAGQSPESINYNKEGKGLAFYQGKKDFGDVYINPPTVWTTEITKEAIKNDILMSVRAPVGPVNIATEHICIGRGLAAIRATDRINQAYLFNYLLKIEKELVGNAGAVFNSINKTQIESLKVPLPSLATQQKIVAKLDAIFAEIDVAITAAEANAKNAEALFQSYLTEVFERGSEGWKEIKIKELGKVVTGNTPKTNEPENYGDFISFVKPGDFKGDGSIDLEKQKLSLIGMNKSRVIDEKSALMVCIGATIGKCGYTETKITTNQQVNSITPTEQFNHIFIYLQMLTNDFQNRVNIRSGQATLPIINKSKWESLTLKFPALNDQIKIVNRFNTLRIETDNFMNSKLSKLNELNILKQSILQKAFSGELVKD